jgi:hypothetical protein
MNGRKVNAGWVNAGWVSETDFEAGPPEEPADGQLQPR